MSSSTGMLRLILLALHGAGGRDQLLFRGDYVPNGNPMRTAPPGPSCWYPNYYCSVTEGNTQTPFVVTGGPSECYSACNADGSCKFFTWFSRRDVQYCYKLSECGSDYQIKDDWCLSRGPSCYSGPRDCSSIVSNNANCTKLADTPSLMEWQCEDGGTGRMVNGYDQNLRAGTRCLLSCDSWTSHRWGGKSPLTYPHREKGYLFSECLANGTWSNVQTNDFTDGATELQFPSPSSLNLTSYPKPDEAPPSCGCDDLVLVWPPPGITDLAVGALAFTYNPRDEDGAIMECEDELQNTKVWADKEFRVVSNNTCRFLCDDYLTATVKCVDGKWSGQTERGFWCWNYPKWEDRLEDRTKSASFSFPAECGINYIEPNNVHNTSRGVGARIVGGYQAVPGSWPWQAYIKWNGSLVCGGTLISDQWLLSAAQCFYGVEDPVHYPNYTIVMGEFDSAVDEGWEQTFGVGKILSHPNFDNIEYYYDFALVKLDHKVELNDHVAPACFPKVDADLTQDFPPGQICITTGWGSTDPDGTVWGTTLKQEYAELWSNEDCNDSNVYPGWITDRMICAGFGVNALEDEERCQSIGIRDGGGPLVCRDSDGRWTHIGVNSWGLYCEDNKYTPGVFANTIALRQWAVQTLTNN